MAKSIAEKAQEPHFFDDVSAFFDHAAQFTKHPQGLLNPLKVCNSLYRFSFPFRRGDSIEVINAWRVENSQHLSPPKCGNHEYAKVKANTVLARAQQINKH